jgi:hypothetical protein
MMALRGLVWCLLVGLVCVLGPVASVSVAPEQKALMLAINVELPQLEWTSTNLDTLECASLTDVMSCNGTGWVKGLYLRHWNADLIAWPSAFADFAALTVLRGDGLSGSFPAFLATMPALESIELNGAMSGPLPSDWTAATSLHTLELTNLAVIGALPLHLPATLERLHLDTGGNWAGSQIPQGYVDHPTLQFLTLSQSGLNGRMPFPSDLANSHISFISIKRRPANAPPQFELYGELPDDLWAWSALQYFSLQDVAINGSFPNMTIPVDCPLRFFEVFDWGGTNGGDVQMTGTIPPEIGRCTELTQFHLWNANMSGTIPPELVAIPALRWLHIASNNFTGSLPTEWPNVFINYLNVARNQLEGPVPSAIRVLIQNLQLNEFYIDYNNLELCGDSLMNVTRTSIHCNAMFNEADCDCLEKWAPCVETCPEPISDAPVTMVEPQASVPMGEPSPMPEPSAPTSGSPTAYRVSFCLAFILALITLRISYSN